jgi:hypothetical protein
MKRIVLSILAFIFFALLVISNNKDWMTAISDYRFSCSWEGLDPHKHGDLYSMCYIQKYKEPISEPAFKRYNSKKKAVDLYILHDSYLQNRLNTNNFYGIDSLQQIDYRGEPATRTLNPRNASILIIETAQRYARWRLQNPLYFINQLHISKKGKLAAAPHPFLTNTVDTVTWWEALKARCYNPNINSNLEFNLFDYSLFSPFRGWKSSLTNYLFGKLDNRIVISTDTRYLMLKETVDTTASTGIYSLLPESELDSMAAHMNQIRLHFLEAGFKEVWFSMIPNTATVVDSTFLPHHKSNGLMYKIKIRTDSLRIPYLDIYNRFLMNPDKMYKHGDSHWSNAGKEIWVNEVNHWILK